MATLNTLRTKGGWIVTIVIGLALLAFLIGDLAGRNSIFGGREKVGKIDGTSVPYLDYLQKVESMNEIQKLLTGSESMTTEQQDEIRNYAWQQMINETTIFPGLEKMGIKVTEEELLDRMYGNNISPVLLNMGVFTNPQTGAYDKAALQQFVSGLGSDPNSSGRKIWNYLQDQVRQEALMSKYLALVNNMIYVNDAEARVGTERANTTYNARFVGQAYSTVADTLVNISSSDIRKYYDGHKEQYRQTASRDVEYIVFEVEPSTKDFADAKKVIEELTAEFAETENMQQYVTLNSHGAFDAGYYTADQLPADLREYAFNTDRTAVYGPVLDGETYTSIRVSDLRTFPDTIAFRQMGFAPGTEALADSVYNVLLKGGDFLALSNEYSMLPAESMDAGRISTQYVPMELGEQLYGRDKFVKVQNPNGTFLFDVYYRGESSRKAQLARLVYEVEPSAATQQTAYAKASGFFTATAGLQDNFNRIANDSVYSKRVARVQAGQSQVSGMDNAREMIRWAFNAKPGNISSIMEIDNNYIVATLVSASEDGYTPVEQVRTQIGMVLMNEKKADIITEKMKGATSLDALAQTLSGTVGEVQDLNYNEYYVQEIGVDPAVIGAIAGGVTEGQVSKPVKGLTGVYVVELTSKQVSDETSADLERVRLEAQGQYGIQQRAMGALMQLSHVVDGRSKYF